MDLKEIIKWFIPCFHILLKSKIKINRHLTWISLFLLLNMRPSYCADINSLQPSEVNTKNVDLDNLINKHNQSGEGIENNAARNLDTQSMGRTFGRPFKKMMQALIPLVFQIGAASTWAVVAALVGVKTLAVALVILKILLIAGAAKVGVLFGQKGGHHGSWETPHQKEIHLHIHNGHHGGTEEHYPISTWSRDGTATDSSDTKNVNYVLNQYADGPPTIRTPYGNYVKIEPTNTLRK